VAVGRMAMGNVSGLAGFQKQIFDHFLKIPNLISELVMKII
jgi:hypothetical protein